MDKARGLGLKRYFNAIPCPKGHISERFVSNQGCVECQKERTTKLKENNPEKIKIYDKRSRSKPQVKKRRNNQIKIRRREDNFFALRDRLRNRVRTILRKKNLKKDDLISYYLGNVSWETIKAHFEKLFHKCPETGKEMSWENFSEWEIDHIIPFEGIDWENKAELLKITHYKNLQPLWIKEHKIKTKKQRQI